MIRRRSPSAGTAFPTCLSIADENTERAPLGLEAGRRDVAEVLAVRLEGGGDVALDLDLVEVVEVERPRRRDLAPARERPRGEPGKVPRRDRAWGNEVEPELETCLRRRVHGHRPHVRVAVAVGHEDEGHP